MAKIVGKDRSAVKKVTCQTCAAILECTASEVKTARYSCQGDSSEHEYVPCPNCPGRTSAMIKGSSG